MKLSIAGTAPDTTDKPTIPAPASQDEREFARLYPVWGNPKKKEK
jgi:hypothetical protein